MKVLSSVTIGWGFDGNSTLFSWKHYKMQNKFTVEVGCTACEIQRAGSVLLFSDKRKGLLCEKQKLSVPLVRQAPMKKR